MSCSSCTMGTGASAILVDHISVIIRSNEADALPSEYADVHPHWDPGFRIVYPRGGAKFLMTGGVCGVGFTGIAIVNAMDGSQWTLCAPSMAVVGIGPVGPQPFLPTMMKRVASPHGTGAAAAKQDHVAWSGDSGTSTPYGSHRHGNYGSSYSGSAHYGTGAPGHQGQIELSGVDYGPSQSVPMTSIAMAESGGWVPASATLDVPVYYVGGNRARITVGTTKKVYRVIGLKSGGPTGVLVRLGSEVKAFGTGACAKKRLLEAAGIGTGGASKTTALSHGFTVIAASSQFGTAGPSRSRHLQRRRR